MSSLADLTVVTSLQYQSQRTDLAAAFRWTARLDMHEAVANHFSLAVNEAGTQFLMNPNQVHFSRITASSLLLLDVNDKQTLLNPDAPDPTAWGLHGAIHRAHPHIRCLMHVHSTYATVLASLGDSSLPPIDQNSAIFFDRVVVDQDYGGLAFEAEGVRCAQLLEDPKKKVVLMGNHGILVLGDSVADTFNRMYYFERAARNYILALQTGRELRVLSDEIAEKTAQQIDNYPEAAQKHLNEVKAILDEEGVGYAL